MGEVDGLMAKAEAALFVHQGELAVELLDRVRDGVGD
jgi:hypothetical protein